MSKVRSNLNRSSPNTGAFSAGLAALQVHDPKAGVASNTTQVRCQGNGKGLGFAWRSQASVPVAPWVLHARPFQEEGKAA